MFISSKPWQLRSTPKLHSMVGELRRLLKAQDMDERDLLREFWEQCHRLGSMPENVVRRVLHFEPRK